MLYYSQEQQLLGIYANLILWGVVEFCSYI